MIEFFKALYEACAYTDTNDLYTLLDGRFAYGMAEQGWARPYGVYFGLPSISESTWSHDIDDVSFQVNLVSDERSESMHLARSCRNLFDRSTLIIPDHQEIRIQLVRTTPPWHDGECWTVSLEFQAYLIKE